MSYEITGLSENLSAQPGLRQRILDLFRQGKARWTPIEIKRILAATIPTPTKSQLDATLKELVSSGILIYTSHFSISHLEINHLYRIKISDRLLLTSSACRTEKPGVAVVRICNGASFGMGDHPTTRLALKGIDQVITWLERDECLAQTNVLDIGTGSGILAIAALQLGAGRAWGLDIDPIARYEAAANARLNGVEGRMFISGARLEELTPDCFEIVLANLRPPTLKQLFPSMRRISATNNYWVLSGFRPEEGNRIEKQLTDIHFRTVLKLEADNWSALVAKFE